jgi:hypothetical protein
MLDLLLAEHIIATELASAASLLLRVLVLSVSFQIPAGGGL